MVFICLNNLKIMFNSEKVGGLFSTTVRNHMKDFGRIAVCGAISTYNGDQETSTAPTCEATFVFKQIKMEGFNVQRWIGRWMEGLTQMAQWIQEVNIHRCEGLKCLRSLYNFGIIIIHFKNDAGQNPGSGDVHCGLR